MPQRVKPSTRVKVIPKEGELEIILNINITVDGQVSATAQNAEVKAVEEEEDRVDPLVPDFSSSGGGVFGMFGKKTKGNKE